MASLRSPRPTLRPAPRGTRRTAWGRCSSLGLHRRGLSPPTPSRSPGALSTFMKIAEVIPPADQQRLNALKRNAVSAKQAERQERFRQAMLRYRQRLQTRKPGSEVPEPPKPPKAPALS